MSNQSLFESFIPVTMANLEREYPNGLLHRLFGDDDVVCQPSALHPAFYGCYDWHSSVHSFWQVVRAIRTYPHASYVDEGVALLHRCLTTEKIAVEMAYLAERGSFEMPYGMAWLLQLAAELREWATPQAQSWLSTLEPLEAHASNQFRHYLEKLPFPVRTGLHSQTAFALGLVYDWSQIALDLDLAAQVESRSRTFYLDDQNAPLVYEPSASDFLSPTLSEADLMRRVLGQVEFAEWLGKFLGEEVEDSLATYLQPVGIADFSDGQLAHFTGLNMSRAWMLKKIGQALPDSHHLVDPMLELAQQHQDAGTIHALHNDYMVSHWAPTFVVYLLTNR
ncbi:MAG: DUF2891 domain-containing protein [Chloroflexota bacterium]